METQNGALTFIVAIECHQILHTAAWYLNVLICKNCEFIVNEPILGIWDFSYLSSSSSDSLSKNWPKELTLLMAMMREVDIAVSQLRRTLKARSHKSDSGGPLKSHIRKFPLTWLLLLLWSITIDMRTKGILVQSRRRAGMERRENLSRGSRGEAPRSLYLLWERAECFLMMVECADMTRGTDDVWDLWRSSSGAP